MVLLLMTLSGCDYISLPSKEPDPLKKAKPKSGFRFPARERRSLFPTAGHGFASPEVALRKDQCDMMDHGGSVNGPDCATDTIKCGETIIGHTIGGVHRYDSRFYESHFCTPRTTNHDGGDERVYALDMPEGDWTAVVTLDSPCADLDLAAMWPHSEVCPVKGQIFDRCEMWPKDGTAREAVRIVSQKPQRWFVVVEGKNEQEGAFALTVQCRRGLQ